MGTVRDFEWSYTDEPHATRRKDIQKKYPQVKKLFGIDTMLAPKVLFLVALQVCMAKVASTIDSFALLFFLTYTVGGTLNHSLTLGMHEISHNLAFKRLVYNRVLGVVCNMPLGIPSFVSFKRYHMDHHKYQGEDGVDSDIPSAFEVRFFTNAFSKLIWVILQPFWYALRPVFTVPKVPGIGEALNLTAQLSFDAAIVYFFGWKALVYLVAGTLLGMGLHPMAGHFIAEHYNFIKGVETYSYYGPLNVFSFNVGYHNEHHDFPFVPGSRLPLVRALAPEFYDNLPHHTSWVKVIFNYITDPSIGPHSRVKRKTLDDDERRSVQTR